MKALPDDNGEYYIPNLNSGTYQITVEAPGFKTAVQRDIVLRINETPRINVALEVGSVTESVNITQQDAAARDRNRRRRPGAWRAALFKSCL